MHHLTVCDPSNPGIFPTPTFIATFTSAMTTQSKGACRACRARKAKCIPGTPRCVRCTTLGIQDCSYIPVKKRGSGTTLRMGEACVLCRRGKNKCDAKQPCTRCVDRHRTAACTYERFPSIDNAPPKTLRFLARKDPPLASSDYDSSYFLPPDFREQPLTLLLPSSSASEKARDATECPPPPTPFLTTLPSLHFQTVPRPLPRPLSDIPPELLQVSSASESSLDMTFRLKALCQLNRLGLYFTQEKQDAILRGDTSNSVVHRYFVDSAHGMGMHSCAPELTPSMILLQAKHLQRSWESLIHLARTNHEMEKAQALVQVAHGFIIVGLTATAQLYFLKACKIIDKQNFRFLPEYGPPLEFSEQVREDASVLSQVIYLENFLYLTLGGPAPAKTARIEREFRLDLQRVYPCLFEICPLTMRTQSILLVRDAVHALTSVEQAENTGDRRRSCLHLVHSLEILSSDLLRHLQRFMILGDTGGVETIWACCVMCLAHLAALCHFVSQKDTTSSLSMDCLYDLTLDKLCNLFLEVHIEKYPYVDFLTGRSWNTMLDTIDTRLGLCSDAEKGSLQRRKAIIKKAYDDFQENLPGFEPSSFASLVIAADGRSKDSSYPNLLVPEERERYGL
ncbi:hypothetical protein BJ322DRAFT_369059 [Thelephora terrestris]|uniref:Zn(2)-C6 fungal-type domain-containing protein n=1 Tax=Thelephora terrestris TaxID=56493 RepID=A0A9P6H509_9AGAM|nr:hypothetical protein BJ322DRAFT_369059 [Thelephora terrestris]